jgi:putative membrane protein insertion efficiency factor
MTQLALGLIRLYQNTVSKVLPPVCRFQPTCSQYAVEAIKKYGFARGSWLAAKRIIRCNPFSEGGYDPVP